MLSRVADSLYWMSRYLERAEHTARLLDLHLNLMLEESPSGRDPRRWNRVLACLHTPTDTEIVDPYECARSLTFDTDNKLSVAAAINSARENARQVRERISTEMWQELNRLYLFIRNKRHPDVLAIEPHEFFQHVKDGVQTFQGITDSTMSHNEGWHFIQLGRFIERASAIAVLLNVHFNTFPVEAQQYQNGTVLLDNYFEWLGLLKSCTAFEAYVKVYSADLRPERIAEFLLLNEEFPHSARFSADCIQAALSAIADANGTRKSSRVHRLAGRLRAALGFGQIDEIMAGGLHIHLRDILRQCNDIHVAAYESYIAYPVDVALKEGLHMEQ
jgi:uncharacterized alpha-E superfamily protein